jgi:5'-phosphate synthase pdxT subunit
MPNADQGSDAPSSDTSVKIGVLALQGAFREHIAHLSKLPGVSAVEVRQKEQLAELDGLIIPGGKPDPTCSLRTK